MSYHYLCMDIVTLPLFYKPSLSTERLKLGDPIAFPPQAESLQLSACLFRGGFQALWSSRTIFVALVSLTGPYSPRVGIPVLDHHHLKRTE